MEQRRWSKWGILNRAEERRIRLVLHNIRSTYNVGAILRTAEGLGIEEVIYSGCTPVFDNQKLLPHLREKQNRQIAKTALGAEKMVEQRQIDNLEKWIEKSRMEGWKIVGLENNLSREETEKKIVLGEEKVEGKIVLILGEEVMGIPAEIRKMIDCFLEIPMVGRKESFNVSVATGIALWGLWH